MTNAQITNAWLYMAERWRTYVLPQSRDEIDMRLRVWREDVGDEYEPVVLAALRTFADREFPPNIGQVADVIADAKTKLRMSSVQDPSVDELVEVITTGMP